MPRKLLLSPFWPTRPFTAARRICLGVPVRSKRRSSERFASRRTREGKERRRGRKRESRTARGEMSLLSQRKKSRLAELQRRGHKSSPCFGSSISSASFTSSRCLLPCLPAFLLPCLLASLLLLFAGCSPNRAAEPDTINFLIETMPANLDPRIGTDAQSQHVDSLLFSGLLDRDAQMNLRGDLAESWESPDPLTYVFHLRRGVRFHNGRPLTSADVKYTFDSILSGAIKTPKRGSFRALASVETPDAQTVIFHLREPYASFPWNLVRPAVGLVPAGDRKSV